MEEYITKKTQELRLVNFKLITYANLKKYEFQYKLLQPIYKIEPLAVDFVKPLTEVFKEKDQVSGLDAALRQYISSGKVEAFFAFTFSKAEKKF